jgi:hypothetical protein
MRDSVVAIGSAAFSPCGHYRWWLERVWAPERPRLIYVGLNPSRADGCRDDPTLRRLQGFARAWGYGALEVLNLFARISVSPALLRRAAPRLLMELLVQGSGACDVPELVVSPSRSAQSQLP